MSSTIDIPYFSQYESKELIDNIATNKISPIEDPKWKQSGAKSKKEYEYWSHNTCGMACLKMILKKKENKEYKIVPLAKTCTEYGGYILTKNEALGLYYKPFCLFVKKEFDIDASVAPFLSTNRILFEAGNENLIIASVHPSIRNRYNNKPKSKGGHLVLVTGYDLQNETITIHNPSGSYNKSQENYEMTFEEFKKFFAGRGLVVYNNK